MYFLFTYFTELYYFIMHFNFHKDTNKKCLIPPLFKRSFPLILIPPLFTKNFLSSPLSAIFGKLYPPPINKGYDTMSYHSQMSFSLKSPLF